MDRVRCSRMGREGKGQREVGGRSVEVGRQLRSRSGVGPYDVLRQKKYS